MTAILPHLIFNPLWVPMGIAGLGVLVILLTPLLMLRKQLRLERRALRWYLKHHPAPPKERYRIKTQ